MLGPIVDLSSTVGRVDWRLAKGANLKGAIIRLGHNSRELDPEYERNADGLKREAIPFGSYFVTEPWVNPDDELAFVDKHWIPDALASAWDLERWRTLTTAKQELNVRRGLAGLADITRRRPLLYSNLDYLTHKLKDLPALHTLADLWYANPVGAPLIPSVPEWHTPLLFQYLWKARIPGCDSAVDFSVWLGSDESFKDWVRRETGPRKFFDLLEWERWQLVELALKRDGVLDADGFPLVQAPPG